MEYIFQMIYLCTMTKKDSIVLAALQLLAERGVHNTPMSAVAKVAGSGMGTIYNYFPTKEVLINDIYVFIKQRELSMFAPFELDMAVKIQFEQYFKSIITFFRENTAYFRFMEQLQASPIITEESKNSGLIAVKSVYDLIEKGKLDGIIKEIDTAELIQFVGGAVLSFLRNHANNTMMTENLINNHIKMTWDGIKA